ncbi:MAG TPA: carboxypeptidase regulatory-like domain-containing protein [Candidatus Sulfotelmatobacter sp.]
MRLIRSALLSILCVSFSAHLQAQSTLTTGSVRGIVIDNSGAVIQGANVVLMALATGQTVSRSTNDVGMFIFPSQPVGVYALEATASGFGQQRMEGISVDVGQSTTVHLRLQPGQTTDSVVVKGESPLLRLEDSDQSSVIDRLLLGNLPLSGRRFFDFALLVPNASPDGQQGLVSFAGQQGGEDTGYANANGANSFSVDGASASSNYFGAARGGERVPYIFGENAIEEFQVAVSPYRAEYGGAATGFVNVVTHSGADTIHGNAFYYNRNSGTGANDAVSEANGLRRRVDVLQQFGGSLGGAIVKHRAWYFVDYEQQKQKDPISVINPSFSNLDQTDFGVPEDAALPKANASFPVPGALSSPDPESPQYLQNVANALNAIQSNLGVRQRFRNDWSLFTKFDYRDVKDDRFYLSLNWNRFDSPSGMIVNSQTPLYGISTLANSFVRDYHASAGWSHAYGSSLLNELHGSFSRDDQYSTPTGLVNSVLPTVLLRPSGGEHAGGSNLQLGNAGFAGGRTNEALWQISDHISYLRGRHTFKFGAEFTNTHLTDLAFGGFDPDAQAQNGTFRGTYSFSSLSNFALGIYDNFFQSTGKPKFSFNVPYVGLYFHDTYQARPKLTLDLGVREDFQVYPQPNENPAFPLTGQFPNQYRRIAPRFGFAWQPLERTVVRGGFGMFYENFNGLNYRNSVVSNGLLSQQASVSLNYDPNLAPSQQLAGFPKQVSNPALFSAPDISLVDPHFRFPYVLQGSLQLEREILPETVVTIGTTWTHGVHLISSSAYDLNLQRPTGTTKYIVCPPGAAETDDCNGRSVVLANLDSGLLTEGRITSNFSQINALISPGLNNYNSLFVQVQRRLRSGVALQGAYTFSKNMISRGVDFNNQFDFRNTHAPSLLDQRHRLSIAGIFAPSFANHLQRGFVRGMASNWTLSTVMQFASGRPYAALIDSACTSAELDADACQGSSTVNGTSIAASNAINNTAALQSTANSALGINAGSPSPVAGLDSFYGPWTQQVDIGLSRQFNITERQLITVQAQVFNVLNHPNYYVQNGTGVNAIQYSPFGSTCGDGHSQNQTCYLVPNTGRGGFGTLNVINALNGPRVMQFAVKYSF